MMSRFPSPDTTPEAAGVYYETLRRLGPERRLGMVFEMHESARARLAAGVRSRHPDYDEPAVRRAVIRLLLGDALFRKAFPEDETLP